LATTVVNSVIATALDVIFGGGSGAPQCNCINTEIPAGEATNSVAGLGGFFNPILLGIGRDSVSDEGESSPSPIDITISGDIVVGVPTPDIDGDGEPDEVDIEILPEERQTHVFIGYRRIRNSDKYYHTFVQIFGPKGQRFVIRGGPSGSGGVNNQSDAFADFVGSEGNVSGDLGQLVVLSGGIAESIEYRPDWEGGPGVRFQQYVLSTNRPYDQLVNELIGYGRQVEAASIQYGPATENSNAFAFSAIGAVFGVRPRAILNAPGSNVDLRT